MRSDQGFAGLSGLVVAGAAAAGAAPLAGVGATGLYTITMTIPRAAMTSPA